MTKALESSVGAAGETRAGGRDRGRRDVSTFPSPVYVPDTSSGRSPWNLSGDLSLAQLLVLPTRGEAGNLLLASLGADRHDTADGPGGAAGADGYPDAGRISSRDVWTRAGSRQWPLFVPENFCVGL